MDLSRAAHLPVDVFQRKHAQHLPKEQRVELPDKIRDMSVLCDKKGVPTIVVAYGSNEFRFYADFLTRHPTLAEELTLTSHCIKAGETWVKGLWVKGKMGAFDDPAFGEILRENGIDTLIVDGLFAGDCVADTIDGAIKEGFKVVVPLELVGSPGWDGAVAGPAEIARCIYRGLKYKASHYEGRLEFVMLEKVQAHLATFSDKPSKTIIGPAVAETRGSQMTETTARTFIERIETVVRRLRHCVRLHNAM